MTGVGSAPRVRAKRGNNKQIIIVGLIVVVALGFLIWRGLNDATLYFRTADEAVAQRHQLAEKRFRIEGTVVPGSIKANGTETDFVIASKTTTVNVHNSGQPVGIFQDNIPVVLEGHFVAGSNDFSSDRIMVKHSSDYEAKHPDRVTSSQQ